MLGFSAESFVVPVSDPEVEADHLFLLRHTLMNPWLSGDSEGGEFHGRYCEYLERAISTTLAGPW